MFILYVLECMLRLFTPPVTSSPEILISTEKPMTADDLLVGCFGWIILISLIFGIMLFVKYSRNKYRLKKKWKEEKANHKKQVFTKNAIKGWVTAFGISLFILVVGILILAFTDNESIKFIGIIARNIGAITVAYSILIPLFKYLWRKLDV